MKTKPLFALLAIAFAYAVPTGVLAQETFPENGVQDKRPQLYAFTNATIVQRAGVRIEQGTLLIRQGRIEAIGRQVTIPPGAVVRDLQGKYIYPSLIDLYTSYGLPSPGSIPRRADASPQFLSEKRGAYGWNEAIRAEYQASDHFAVHPGEAEKLRKLGFGAVLSHNKDGIGRGTSVLVTLGQERDNLELLQRAAATHYSFNKGSSGNDYPTSLMGAVALLRQTWYDARWYAAGGREQARDLSLEALVATQELPRIFEAADVLDILRADRVGDEFDVQFVFRGNGDSYQRLDLVKATGGALIVPLNFPEAYDMDDPYDARQVSLRQMKHWELAPFNPGRLEAAGIPFAITAEGAEKDFWKNLRKAIACGLSPEQALRSLTEIPAGLIGMEEQLGTLERGKLANFLITTSALFDEDNVIQENWVSGVPYSVDDPGLAGLIGIYQVEVPGLPALEMIISGPAAKPEVRLIADKEEANASFNKTGGLFTLRAEMDIAGGALRLSGFAPSPGEVPARGLTGQATLAGGETVTWSATRTADAKKSDGRKAEQQTAGQKPGPVLYPFTAYGWQQLPKAEKVLIKNATVWTNERPGVLQRADVLIEQGKIAAVGTDLRTGGARVIDAEGKHLTPGIVDEHSHIACTRGINEAGQAVSAEVRMGDVINSEDINIYRQLAGGVTTSHILHGSANPIGGQSQLIKLRWGQDPEGLKFEGADGFIKFALGENVKQSNWGDNQTTRFPQTRMGVQQVMVDAFQRAKEYGKARGAGGNVRRDLELDALLEILNEKRFITCHSYVQSEIAMLMHVADSMGFRVNTFTHILEGYKLADEMAAHGAAGSTFSDWWAYKMEVKDAIPYNAAMMHQAGVLAGINSDDAEMARRLNQEAAKAVMYGGLSEEEALKLVTLNPARMLHIDDRVGSIAVGKDADLVIWSDHPLSIYAKVEKTFVDGIAYYDADRDAELQQHISRERARLTGKMLGVKQAGGSTQKPVSENKIYYHCEDVYDEFNH